MDALVNGADDAEEDDAGKAYDEADAGVTVAFERGDGGFVGGDVHRFDD